MATTPAPGWYTDPGDATGLRYWDGAAWTDRTARPGEEGAIFAPPTGLTADAKPAASTKRRVGIIAAIALGVGAIAGGAIALTSGGGAHTPVAGAPQPGPGMVQFTSDDGSLTINVPDTWNAATAESREYFDTMMPDAPMKVVAAWDLDGGEYVGGSTVVIGRYGTVSGELDDIAATTFASLQDVFGGGQATFPDDFTTDDGVRFVQMDLTLEVGTNTMEMIELIGKVDGRLIEIATILVGSNLDDTDEALSAYETLTFG